MNQDELFAELILLRREDRKISFPYDDCHKLRRGLRMEWEDLESDLNQQWMEVVGSASAGEEILQWPEKDKKRLIKYLNQTFYERFPIYVRAETAIQEGEYPALKKVFNLVERMRLILMTVLDAPVRT